MRYGLYAPNFGDFANPDNLLALTRDAEAAGWEGFFLWDHMVLQKGLPLIDAWVALAAIAARTEKLVLGPMITPVARRRPWKVAREIVSLDRVSRGRAVLGVGLGDPAKVEFEGFGEDPDARVRAEKLDEGLTIIAGLCGGEPFQHQGKHFRVAETSFVPAAVQRPRVPIWVAGFWPRKAPMRRAARWDGVFPLRTITAGSGWAAMWPTPDTIREVVAFVRAERGDSQGHFDVVATGATKGREDSVAALAEAGATWWLEWLDDQRGSFAEMLERVRLGPPRL